MRSVQEFTVDGSDPFVTPAEASNFEETASYDEVTTFFTKLVEGSPYV